MEQNLRARLPGHLTAKFSQPRKRCGCPEFLLALPGAASSKWTEGGGISPKQGTGCLRAGGLAEHMGFLLPSREEKKTKEKKGRKKKK